MNWKIILTILPAVFFVQLLFSQNAVIKGNVYDKITRDGLAGAYVTVASGGKTVSNKFADEKGNFQISGLAPDEYRLTFENVGYGIITQHVSVKGNETAKIYIALEPDKSDLNAVTVVGYHDNEKESGARAGEKNSASINNIISSQAMVRSPDINAANVLQRMSGITVQRSNGGDEAYAIIRGMEPRYNNTLLNGIKIASPDDKNRFVQLDIIPSDILSSIEISKSLTPDMEGDAIGGTVNMIVKNAPQIASFKATASIGYSQLFFNEKFIYFKKSDIQSQSPIARNPNGYAAQPNDFSRSNLDFQPKQVPPNTTVGFSYTQRFLNNKLGVVLADNLQNQYYGNISFRYGVSPINITSDTLGYLDVTNFKGYTQQLNNGLVAHIDYAINEKNRIGLDNFFIYSYLAQSTLSEDTTLIGTGRVGPGTGQIFPANRSYTQNTFIENLKLSGQHYLKPNLIFDWAGVISDASRNVPDLATVGTDYRIQANGAKTTPNFDEISRQWFKNDDKDYTGIINFAYNKTLNSGSLNVKAGGLYRDKSRYNYDDEYLLRPSATNSTGGANTKPPWTNIYEAQWDVYNSAGANVYNTNNYTAAEVVFAEYIMASYKSKKFEFGGGLRVENTSTNWDIKVHNPTQPSSGNQTYQDFLPSFYFKYTLSKKEDLHFTYFKSISRPNYYELVPAESRTPDFVIIGNPRLLHAIAENFDIRYEIFPKGDQHFFVGVFYKTIQNPIEQVLVSEGGGRLFLTPVNSTSATNYGAEIVFTKYWGKFGLTGNYTYTNSTIMSSKTTLNHGTVNESHPMQGETPNIVNVSLLYKDVRNGLFAQLAYEYQGTTLTAISIYYQSDYYQQPMNTLAFSIEKDIHKHFTVFGKFNNLLNTPTISYIQKTLLVSKDTYMGSFSLGVRYAH